jgi:hypothetical protein
VRQRASNRQIQQSPKVPIDLLELQLEPLVCHDSSVIFWDLRDLDLADISEEAIQILTVCALSEVSFALLTRVWFYRTLPESQILCTPLEAF